MTDHGGAAVARRLVTLVSLLAAMGLTRPHSDASAAAAAATAPQVVALQPERYAVVVNPATPASELSLGQLRRIFRGEQQFWSGGGRVVLFVQAPGTSERAAVLRHVYEMDEGAFKRYWIAKTFRDEVASGPKIVSTSALARKLTATIPGAIAIVPLSSVDDSVRVLRVDGRLPTDAGYALTDPGS